MNKQPTIYFAHPFHRRFSKRKEMLIKKLKEKGFIVIDPFTGENKLAIKYGVGNFYENPCRKFALDIKKRDFKQVDKCDCLFVWIPKKTTTIGTIREFDRALVQSKYIIVLCYRPSPFLEDANELYLSYKDFLERREFVWS